MQYAIGYSSFPTSVSVADELASLGERPVSVLELIPLNPCIVLHIFDGKS